MHESLYVFNFRPDTTTNPRVVYPCKSGKIMLNVVNTLASSFFIGTTSFLQVKRTIRKSWTSTKFDQIRPWTAELAALERQEKSP